MASCSTLRGVSATTPAACALMRDLTTPSTVAVTVADSCALPASKSVSAITRLMAQYATSPGYSRS